METTETKKMNCVSWKLQQKRFLKMKNMNIYIKKRLELWLVKPLSKEMYQY